MLMKWVKTSDGRGVIMGHTLRSVSGKVELRGREMVEFNPDVLETRKGRCRGHAAGEQAEVAIRSQL